MDNNVPLFAGKYELIRRLAVGGMGEIFLARQKGIEGFEKTVVVKRILRRYASEESFVGMFLDEARIASDLRHPNIVTFFEVGKCDGTYFIAMEYVEGWNLGEIMGRCTKRGKNVPLDCVLQIVHDVAGGLHYAHIKTDSSGQPLNIIHRDVTLRNIVVSISGVAKILDFGLAKATCQTQLTLPGKLKGTPSYLAPEQLEGVHITCRTDLFALGTILFELTTQRRLFRRSSPVQTMSAVLKCEVPRPTSLVDDYPPALEAVVMKALQRNPDDRFQTAEAFQLALEEVMESHSPRPTPTRLGRFVRKIVSEYDEEQREGITSDQDVDISSSDESLSSTQVSDPNWVSRVDASSLGDTRTNIPEHHNTFVGSQTSMQRLARRFSRTNLVTLLGAAGIGKTRLATEFARANLKQYLTTGGAWLCELESAQSVEDICGAVAGAMNIQLAPVDVAKNLGKALKSRPKALIILDNFERVAEYAKSTVELWAEIAPDVQFLITSRQALSLRNEETLDVAPLSLPTRNSNAKASEAVQLFIDRTSIVKANYGSTAEQLKDASRIVRKLDGIPLAIELAASQMEKTTAPELLKQLSQRFDVLAKPGKNKGGKTRHDTLTAALDWSWDLLSPCERSALAQCSVFRSGFDPEAAVAVIDLTEYPEAPWVIDVISSLRHKSLVTAFEPDEFKGELRYKLFQSICDYARRKLIEDGDRNKVRERHSAHYLELGRRWYQAIGPQKPNARKRISQEMGNFVAIHQRALGRKPVDADRAANAMLAALSLFPLLSIRGPYTGYLHILNSTVKNAAADKVDVELRTEVHLARGQIRRLRGRLAESRRDLNRAVQLAKEANNHSALGRALTELGILCIDEGKLQPAEKRLTEALTTHVQDNDIEWQARTLDALGTVSLARGSEKNARMFFEKALPLFRAANESVLEGACLRNYATLLQATGELDAAENSLNDALEIHEQARARLYEAYALASLASVSHEKNNLNKARVLYDKALTIFVEIGNRRWVGTVNGYLGLLSQEGGQLKDALTYCRKAEVVLEETGDVRTKGFFQCCLGAIEALINNTYRSSRALESAATIAEKIDDPLLKTTVELSRGFLDVAHAAECTNNGDSSGAEAHYADARRKVDHITDILGTSTPDDNATRTAGLSDVLRINTRHLASLIP